MAVPFVGRNQQSLSNLDMFFRQGLVFSKLFTQSWGPPEVLKTLRHYQHKYSFQGTVIELIERDLPRMVIEKNEVTKDWQRQEGHFHSPLDQLSPMLFQSGRNNARAMWRGYFPPPGRPRNGLVIHLAPTGDHYYRRREWQMVWPLLELGVSSILLQNPFYGDRKPKEQFRSTLHNVSDLYVMGGGLICECCFLLRWAREQGFSPLGLSGVSMGGYMASLAATNVQDHPVSLVPIISWTSAAPVYTQGALSDSIPWQVLAKELEESRRLKELLRETGWADLMEDKEHPAHKLFPDSPAKRLMWILMEEFTNLANYPVPLDSAKVHFVVAGGDAYVPRCPGLVPDIRELWPGATVTEIPKWGHVGTYLWYPKLFHQKILDTLGLDRAELMSQIPEKRKTEFVSWLSSAVGVGPSPEATTTAILQQQRNDDQKAEQMRRQ